MTSEKCRKCGLVNPAASGACKRCGSGLMAGSRRSTAPESPRAAARRFSLWPLIVLLSAVGMAYYLYSGVEKSYENVAATDDKRVSTERKDAPPGLSRTQYDNRRAGQYGNAVANSPALATSQQHTNEINKLMK